VSCLCSLIKCTFIFWFCRRFVVLEQEMHSVGSVDTFAGSAGRERRRPIAERSLLRGGAYAISQMGCG
jgi:hypothetical protein